MSRLKKIYDALPPVAQNWAITLQGFAWRRGRYGDVYREESAFLRASERFTADQFRELQLKRLNDMVREAAAGAPYYRETLGGRPPLKSVEDLASLPFLEKDTFRRRITELINPDRLRYGTTEGHTSGTTGSPVIFPYDNRSMQMNFALRDRQYEWAGISAFDVSARFSGRILLGKNQGPPFWRHNGAEHQWLMSVYHMNDETLPLYFGQLQRVKPVYLDGYPSALYVLARWILNEGREGQLKPRAILATAETLLPHQRAAMEQAFACKVFDFYSSSEGAPFITQCEHGSRHVNPESGIIEFLRADGSSADAGEDAEMVMTGFFQRTVPLIRYRIGDVGRRGAGTGCPCGRQMPLVERVVGRLDDSVGEAGRVGSAGLSTALYCAPNAIREAQIAEIAPNTFELRYVPVPQVFTESHLADMVRELRDRLGNQTDIRAVELPRIPRGANGKFRAVVREWKPADAGRSAALSATPSSS